MNLKTATATFYGIGIACIAAFLMACNSAKETNVSAPLPEGLKDCRFFTVYDEGLRLNIVRCPNSSTSTTYKNGKASATVAVSEN